MEGGVETVKEDVREGKLEKQRTKGGEGLVAIQTRCKPPLTSNLGLVGHTRQFQKPMSSGLIQHWHFLLRPMSSGHNHDIHRNMYEVFKEAAPAKTHSRTLCHHCVTRVPGSGI